VWWGGGGGGGGGVRTKIKLYHMHIFLYNSCSRDKECEVLTAK